MAKKCGIILLGLSCLYMLTLVVFFAMGAVMTDLEVVDRIQYNILMPLVVFTPPVIILASGLLLLMFRKQYSGAYKGMLWGCLVIGLFGLLLLPCFYSSRPNEDVSSTAQPMKALDVYSELEAKSILADSVCLSSVKVYEGGRISNYSLAFNKIWMSKDSEAIARNLFANAESLHGKIYALIIIFELGCDDFDALAGSLNADEDVSCLFGCSILKASVKEVLDDIKNNFLFDKLVYTEDNVIKASIVDVKLPSSSQPQPNSDKLN